ncbi:MAG: sugar ABC transporter permease [Lachnospiraceae bacterium]|nr:sugar ABC transporter permease [Lachnospiraceae bacterium]
MKKMRIHPGHIVLVIMSVVWLFPIFYIVMNSFRGEGSFYVNYIIPKQFSLENYRQLFDAGSKFHYGRWYVNTFVVAAFACVCSSLIVLATAYSLSRIRFRGRKVIMNFLLILGMFPAFMSMIAVYYILKGMGLAQSLPALVIVYSAGAALNYYVAKGFFDTIPRSLDEAAFLDGANKWTVFTRITIPLSKSIIIYTVLTGFISPWADYIFASIILGDKSGKYTIAMGLYGMLSQDNIDKYFKQFAAGAVLVALPIAALFIALQRYYVEGLAGSVKG